MVKENDEREKMKEGWDRVKIKMKKKVLFLFFFIFQEKSEKCSQKSRFGRWESLVFFVEEVEGGGGKQGKRGGVMEPGGEK